MPPPTRAKITAAIDPIRAELEKVPAEQRWLVTSEGAFSYLARDFGLKPLYLWPINADQQGTPQQVRRVVDLMRKDHIPVIFSESTISAEPAKQVARETGARYGGVLYVDSPLRPFRPGAHLSRRPEGDERHHRRRADREGGAMNAPLSRQNLAEAGAGILVEHVTVTYRNGHTALRDASFAIPTGTITALVGVNGSGKSTLFKTIMGFLKAARGEVRILGLSVPEALKRQRGRLCAAGRGGGLDLPVLVEDVVMMGRYGHMNFLRIPGAADRAAVEAALARVNMLDFRKRQIGELSGGQRKRVFLARALAQDARVILLDEPFTGVDVKTEDAIIGLLRALRDEGRVMLVSTHNLGSVPEFCDRTVLVKGTVLAYGLTSEVFTQANLEKAFGGVLRHFVLDESHAATPGTLGVLTDDERPLVLYKDRPAQSGTASSSEGIG